MMRSSRVQLELIIRFSRSASRFIRTVLRGQGERTSGAIPGELVPESPVGSGIMLVMVLLLLAVSMPVARSLMGYTRAGLSLTGSTRVDPSPGQGLALTLPSVDLNEPVPVASVLEEASPSLEAPTYEEMFQEIGPQYDLDWRILASLAYRESRMNYLALGRSNDMGLMQVIPPTWNEWAPKVEVFDPFDPYSNILVGAAYLAFVRDFSGKQGYSEPKWMLVAYNWGPNRLKRFWDNGGTWSEIPATQRKYALRILAMAADRSVNPAVFDQIYTKMVVDQ